MQHLSRGQCVTTKFQHLLHVPYVSVLYLHLLPVGLLPKLLFRCESAPACLVHVPAWGVPVCYEPELLA
jgi:hypothetical protein